MPDDIVVEQSADVATEADVKAVETKVEQLQTEGTEPPWVEGLVERIAIAVFDRTKKFTDTLLEASEAAVEAVAQGGNEVEDTTQQDVTDNTEQEEDIKPERRSHRLFHKPLKKKE